MTFTGIADVDKLVLMKLDDTDLASFCSTNSKIKKLCDDDNFWRNRTVTRFGKYFDVEKYKNEYKFKTWKSYYIDLINLLENLYLFIKLPPEYNYADRKDYTTIREIMDNSSWVDEIKRIFETKEFPEERDWKIILDEKLKKDLINPNILFIWDYTLDTDNWNDDPESFRNLITIMSYLIKSKDRRIRPNYELDRALKLFYSYTYTDNKMILTYIKQLLEMFLNDKRTNPNILLEKIAEDHDIDFANAILKNPRIRSSEIQKTFDEIYKNKVKMTSKEFDLLLNKYIELGGNINKIRYSNYSGKDLDKIYSKYKNISNLRHKILDILDTNHLYSDETYQKILKLL